MDKSMTCCFTGHRKLPENHIPGIVARLEEAIERLIHKGVREFCAGGALGFDTLAALRVLKFKEQYPDVRLVLILPCKDQTKYWSASDVSVYENIRERADDVIYTAEHSYRGCMHVRNRALVDRSAWCVCYLVEPRGGTKYTVDYARKKGLPVLNVAEIPEETKTEGTKTDTVKDTSAADAPKRADTSAMENPAPKAAADAPQKRRTAKTARPAGMAKIQDPAKTPKPLDMPETAQLDEPAKTHVRAAALKEPKETPDVCSFAFRARFLVLGQFEIWKPEDSLLLQASS